MKRQFARITLDIKKLPEGHYLATSTDVQGLIAQGKTFEETVAIAEDVAVVLLQEQRIHGIREAYIPADHITYPLAIRI